MDSFTEFKSVFLDIFRTVVGTMAERVRAAEEALRNPFVNRTDIYRCEDGRPICYCCLKVGHVAKYCWNRRYSCFHVSLMDHRTPPEPSPQRDHIDVQSLERDVNKLLKELQRITRDLEFSRTTHARAKDIPPTSEYLTDDKDQVGCVNMRSQAMTYGVRWPERCRFVDAKCLPACIARNIEPCINDYHDIT